MSEAREIARRLVWIAALGAAIALLAGGLALAASQTIVASDSTGNRFSSPTYTTDQGEVVPFQNIGGNQHNATASANGPDGKALFRSATIGTGTAPVSGTQYLSSGSYPFICTIHPTEMQATLVVTGNGTPQPRPQLTLTLVSKKLAKVVRKGKLQVGVNSNVRADEVSIEAKLGKTSLGRLENISLPPGQATQVLKLKKAAKNKLAGRSKATITLEGTVAFGVPASVKGKLK